MKQRLLTWWHAPMVGPESNGWHQNYCFLPFELLTTFLTYVLKRFTKSSKILSYCMASAISYCVSFACQSFLQSQRWENPINGVIGILHFTILHHSFMKEYNESMLRTVWGICLKCTPRNTWHCGMTTRQMLLKGSMVGTCFLLSSAKQVVTHCWFSSIPCERVLLWHDEKRNCICKQPTMVPCIDVVYTILLNYKNKCL